MTCDPDLFDREKALRCFGSEKILQEVLQQFLSQADAMLEKLRLALDGQNQTEARKVVHWFRGGLSYLFSPAIERLCLQLDQETQADPLPDLQTILEELASTMQRLKQSLGQ